MSKKSIRRYVSFVLIFSICVSFFVFESKPAEAADIEKKVTPILNVNLGGEYQTVESSSEWNIPDESKDFIAQSMAETRNPRLSVSVTQQVTSLTTNSLFSPSFPSDLKQLLTKRIEGSNISLTVSNVAKNKWYEIYIYTAEFDAAKKHAFDIFLQGKEQKSDSVDASMPNYVWQRKGPYFVYNKDKDLSIELKATKDYASISAIEINRVEYTGLSFADVQPDNTYYPAIMELASLDIIKGSIVPGDITTRKFNPGDAITGEETAFMLFRMMDNSIKQISDEYAPRLYYTYELTNPMADVMPNFWAYNYMRAFYNYFYKEIPTKEVTREEFIMAQIASKRLDYNENGRVFVLDPYLEPSCRLMVYDDTKLPNIYNPVTKSYTSHDPNNYNETSSFKYYVELALEKGLLKGYTDNTIRPYEKVKREEAAQFFFNILNNPENNFYSTLPEGKKAPSPRITLTKRNINVGILTLNTCEDPNPDFTLFELLDRNINKPMDWVLVNPIWELTKVTEDDIDELRESAKRRYSTTGRDLEADRDNTGAVAQAYNMQYCKDYFHYWEVDISKLSAKEIAQNYDILFQTSHRYSDYTQDRQKIIDLLASGGQMWWENCVGMKVKNSFTDENLSFFEYDPKPNGKTYAQVPALNNKEMHPLIDSLFKINDKTSLRTNSVSNFVVNSELSMLGDVDEWNLGTKRIKYGTDDNFPSNFEPVVYVSKDGTQSGIVGPSVVCQLFDNVNTPDGRLVISTNDVGCGLTKHLNCKGYKSVEDYKFCYNLINWMGKVSVDFGDTSQEAWDSDTEPTITATITNFGGKTQEYKVDTLPSGNWSLENPEYLTGENVKNYKELMGTSGYEWILAVDSSGYPSKIVLEPNESVNIDYHLSINSDTNTTNKLDVQVYEAYVDSYDEARDKDTGKYNMTYYKLTSLDLSSKVNYYTDVSCSTPKPGIHGYVDFKLKSPISGDGTFDSSNPYKYILRVQFFKGTIDPGKKLPYDKYIKYNVLSDNDTTKEDSNIMYQLDELNNKDPNNIIITDTNAPPIVLGEKEKGVDFGVLNYTDTSTGINYNDLTITVNGIKFTTASQYLTIRLPLENLPNNADYSVGGTYTVNKTDAVVGDDAQVGASKGIGVCHIKEANTYQPAISAKVLSRDKESKTALVQVDYTIPQYTDEYVDPYKGISNYITFVLPNKIPADIIPNINEINSIKKVLDLNKNDKDKLIGNLDKLDVNGTGIIIRDENNDGNKDNPDELLGPSSTGLLPNKSSLANLRIPIKLDKGIKNLLKEVIVNGKSTYVITGTFQIKLPYRDDYVATLVTKSQCLGIQQSDSKVVYCAPDVN